MAVAGALFNVAIALVTTLLAPYALEAIGMPVWMFGLLSVPAVALGTLARLLVRMMGVRLGARTTLIAAYIGAAVGFTLIASAGRLPMVGGACILSLGLALIGSGAIISLVIARSARQSLVPAGRVSGVSGLVRTLTWGVDPLTAVLAGFCSTLVFGHDSLGMTVWA